MSFQSRIRNTYLVLALSLTVATAASAQAGTAKGSLTYTKGSAALTNAYLVKGPDSFDATKMIRKLIFSPTDIGAKILACTTLSCVEGGLDAGLTVELDAGPRLNYWMVLNNQLVQYSGTQEPTALQKTADDAKHLAGKLAFDASAAGGPKVDVVFDAPLVKEFTKAR